MKRPATPADAVLGREPGVVLEPASIDEARAALASLSQSRQTSVFVGGGTKLGLGAPPSRLDAVVSTTKLSRIVEYAPADQVVTVEAGVTLGALQARLAVARQRLSLDAPWPAKATLGGILAASSFGPGRARSGGVRDLILGVSLVRADGALARGGGKVVKNVAGFDLPKLVCGSLGTLGLIASATLRVHPVPEATETCVVRALSPAGVLSLVQRIVQSQLEPAALLATDAWDLALRFEGFGKGVLQQVAHLRTFADVALVRAEAEDPFESHRRARETAALALKIAALPTSLPRVAELLAPLRSLLPGAVLDAYPTLGVLFLSAPEVGPGGDHATRSHADATVAALLEARRALGALRGTLTVEAAPPGVRERIEPWSAPTSLALHRAVKSRFDPDGLLAPGRFVGGI